MSLGLSKKRGRYGRTLVELMIASGLLMLLLASCAMALRSAMTYYRRIDELTRMENSLLSAVTLLNRDTAETARAAVAYAPLGGWEGEASMTFPVPRNAQGELLIDHTQGNRLLFGSVISYRVGADKKLRRYSDPLGTAVGIAPHPLELSPSRDSAYFASRRYNLVAEGVETFELDGIDIAQNGFSTSSTWNFREAEILRLTLRLERNMAHRYGVSMVLDLVPKN